MRVTGGSSSGRLDRNLLGTAVLRKDRRNEYGFSQVLYDFARRGDRPTGVISLTHTTHPVQTTSPLPPPQPSAAPASQRYAARSSPRGDWGIRGLCPPALSRPPSASAPFPTCTPRGRSSRRRAGRRRRSGRFGPGPAWPAAWAMAWLLVCRGSRNTTRQVMTRQVVFR